MLRYKNTYILCIQTWCGNILQCFPQSKRLQWFQRYSLQLKYRILVNLIIFISLVRISCVHTYMQHLCFRVRSALIKFNCFPCGLKSRLDTKLIYYYIQSVYKSFLFSSCTFSMQFRTAAALILQRNLYHESIRRK